MINQADPQSAPKTFNAEQRTLDAVLSKGSPVQRAFGVEQLRISRSAVDLSRLETSGIPILDSHEQRGISNALGRLTRVWFEGKSMLGRIRFNETDEGDRAMGWLVLVNLRVGAARETNRLQGCRPNFWYEAVIARLR